MVWVLVLEAVALRARGRATVLRAAAPGDADAFRAVVEALWEAHAAGRPVAYDERGELPLMCARRGRCMCLDIDVPPQEWLNGDVLFRCTYARDTGLLFSTKTDVAAAVGALNGALAAKGLGARFPRLELRGL
jgi:hypothetical protein